MTNFFTDIKDYVRKNYIITEQEETYGNNIVNSLLGFELTIQIKYIYEHYEKFSLCWFDNEDNYVGEIHFVPYNSLLKEHADLIEIMNESYNADLDEYSIKQDILNWYPLFKFKNGDAFCVDKRNGKIVYYEHEVFDTGKNLHGLVIANTISDLYEKWSRIHFSNIYYWDEIVDENGIDLTSELAKKYL